VFDEWANEWVCYLGPIVFEKSYEKGGHFAGWKHPGGLVDGLCEMFRTGGSAYRVVKGLEQGLCFLDFGRPLLDHGTTPEKDALRSF
jgi:hypothetical protein